MENADAEAAEESRDKGVGRDEDEDEEQDHGTSDDKSSSANSHSEDSEVAAAGATPIRVYESGSDSVLSNDNTCATADASVTTTSRYYRSDYVVQKRRNKRSSLDLRKLPVSILLQPGDDNDGDGDDYEDDYDDESSLDHDDIDEQIDKAKAHSQANQGKLSFLSARNILQSTCLNARYKLKTQMMLSFGVVSFFTVGIVVFVGLITVLLTGQRVQNITHDTLQDLAQSIAGTTARYLADEWTTRFLPVDLVDILCRATQERFAGYPMDNDSDVPFRNIYYDGGNNDNNAYQYPIKGRPLPLDWQILNSQEDILLVTDDNHQEHVQKRWPWYQTKQEGDSSSPLLSTSSASFFMQGTCDPSSAPGSQAYFPNCKDINNNITSGGAIFADESIATNELIHRKASDLNPLLKALYEYHQDVKSIGLYFSNSGAGATVVFPHFMGGNSQIYNSSGCNWLLNTHPLDRSKTIASLDDFERCHQSVVYDDTNIHQRGNMVPERLYNPLDTDWCPKQAMEPDSKGFHVHGPYLRSNNGGWQLSLGRAIYDPVTQEFIACTSVDFMLSHIQSILQETVDRSNGQLSHLTIVKYNSEGQNEKLGEVVASTNWNLSESNQTVTIDELQIGVRQEDFQTLHDLVDFSVSTPWDPSAAKHAYESFMLRGGNMSEDNGNAHYLVAAHPLPPIPDQYSPDYEPEFLVIVSIREEDFLKSANLLSDTVDEKVADLLVLIFVVGGVGFILMTVILFMVAQTLTTPLNYMNEIAADIMHSYGDYNIDANANIIENGEERDENGDEDGSKKEKPIKDDSLNPVTEYERTKHLLQHRCGPKTELSDIVAEFLRMVREFSGKANAKTDQQKVTEIENRFNLMEDFKDLYASREGSCSNNFKYTYTSKKITNNNKAADLRPEQSMSSTAERENPDSGMNMSDLKQPQRLHFGRIIIADDETKSTTTRNSDFMHKNNFTDKRMTSPLFFWVVVLIVTPLLVTTVTISTILMVNIARHFPDFIDDAKDVFIREEIFALRTYVDLKASLTASTTMRAVRDLHVLSRYASWLVFGGLNFSDSHTYLTSGVEQCKAYSDQFEECPYFQELSCNLADRRIQSAFYVGESHDTNVLGNRNITSYPKVSFMPETTAWWYNVTAVPGAEKGRLAGGYETTFDRLRSASAIPVFQLLYNYEFFGEQTVLGSFVAFEDDGLFVGYLGCEEPGHVSYSSWHSNVDNGAADLRPELCPLGKFGYDPRCRSWYDKGSKATGGNASFFYATPPYLFAATNTYAQSGSSPLIEPRTGKHVGQTLIDFNSQPIIDSLSKENFALTGKGFPILITIESDNFGADTVIGPGREEEAKPIADLVLANDPECIGSACKEGFFKIVEDMKLGKTGTSEFSRVSDEGSIEAIYISYAPVIVKSFAPTDSTDFDRGVVQSDYVLYSLAFAQPEEDMLQPFGEVERDIEKQFYITLIVLCTTIALATAFVFYFSHAITVSMTEPMFYLLELIHHINQASAGSEPPEPNVDHGYGSEEVLNVTITMQRLHKVIRGANTAFFSGDVETAYRVLKDALKLFKHLDNKKAIGVACNNLGNAMLAAYRTLKATKEKRICGFQKKEIIAKGTAWFHEAIQQGEKAYDDFYEAEGWSPNCLDFMQHLSNRYFNRAIFLLTVKEDHDKPDEIEELGKRDLQISRDMDVEINDEGTQVGWDIRGVSKKFEVMLSRFRGHLILLELGYSDEFELNEWMDEAFHVLKTELKKTVTSDLFQDMTPAGRMQQIESELMKYYVLQKDMDAAAKIAIRMLVEDEYALPSALTHAVQVLESYLDTPKDSSSTSNVEHLKKTVKRFRRRLEEDAEELDSNRLNAATKESLDAFSSGAFGGRSAPLGTSEPFKMSEGGAGGSVEFTKKRQVSLRESTRGEITMETF